MRYNNDPREITARFDSKCSETGRIIKKGETCIYYPMGKKVYHNESKTAEDFRSWQFDCNVLGGDY